MFLRQCLAFGMVSIREPHLSCKAHSLSCVESQFQQSGASWGRSGDARAHSMALTTTVTMMRLMTMSQKTLSILAEWGTHGERNLAPRSQQWARPPWNDWLRHRELWARPWGREAQARELGSTMGTRLGCGTMGWLGHRDVWLCEQQSSSRPARGRTACVQSDTS
jgi:hypothetical protein